MVAKRVNLTIEGDLHDKATSYAEEKGMSFSALVAKAISQYMKAGDHTPITSESILMGMSQEERSGLMRPIVTELMDDFLSSDDGKAFMASIAKNTAMSVPLDDREIRSQVEVAPREHVPPSPKSGSITITEEFRERLKKFGPTALEKVSGVGKGDISKMQRGIKDGVSEKNYRKLETGIAILEADAAKNAVLPSE